ncbi:TolC family protein, partial [uncultured Muribaculum sp.]
MSKTIKAFWVLFFAAASLSASEPCGSGGTVLDTIPEQWAYTEHFNQEMPDNDAWWQTFADPVLDSLINEGVRANYDAVMALRRIEIARQQLLMARAAYMPSLDLGLGWSKSRSSGATVHGNPVQASVSDYFDVGLNMSWEIDVFGKITAKSRQKKDLYNVSKAEYAAAMVTVCANIAKTYVSLRVYQAQWKVATEHIESQKRIVGITEARMNAGLASMLDVTQARVVYYSTRATLPGLESLIHNTINSLSVLLGTYPENMYARLENVAPLPDYRAIVPIGV